MHILRALFYLLLTINLALFLLGGLSLSGHQPPWQTTGESERLKRQLAVDQIRLQQTTPAGPAAAPAETVTAASAPPPQADPEAMICAALKNLSADDVARIGEQLAPPNDKIELRSSGVQPTSWWVNIPPGGGREGAMRRGEILTKAGITDYIIVREAGPNQFAISLGLFRNEEAAKRLIDQLQKKNVKTARITVRDNTHFGARVELRGSAARVMPLLDEITSRIKNAQRDDCQPG